MKINYSNPPGEIIQEAFQKLISQICVDHKTKLIELTYVFMSDEELLEMNIQHLNHDYYTDILTFDLAEESNQLWGDFYISTDRVKDNAQELKQTYEQELKRVMVHGVLHLIGDSDTTKEEIEAIRQKEDHYINLHI